MTRALVTLHNMADRQRVMAWVMRAPDGWQVEIKEPKRSVDQNARLWASLTDVAAQCTYHGLKLEPADWKVLFMDALDRDTRMVPNLDGNGFISLGRSSSKLTKGEFSALLEVIYAWGSANGVTFHDGQEAAA